MEMCHKSGEKLENRDRRRKPGVGNEKRQSPGNIRMVGKYTRNREPKCIFQYFLLVFTLNYRDCMLGSECCQNMGELHMTRPECILSRHRQKTEAASLLT